jgi:hypothetical protein
MKTTPKIWSHSELLQSLKLYQELKKSKVSMTASNPRIQQLAKTIGRTAAAVAMRMGNFLALDSNGTNGLKNGGPSLAKFWRRHTTQLNQSTIFNY